MLKLFEIQSNPHLDAMILVHFTGKAHSGILWTPEIYHFTPLVGPKKPIWQHLGCSHT